MAKVKIRRIAGIPKTTSISAPGVSLKFAEDQDEFEVEANEVATAIHHGNFKEVVALGDSPAPKIKVAPPQPVAVPESSTETDDEESNGSE